MQLTCPDGLDFVPAETIGKELGKEPGTLRWLTADGTSILLRRGFPPKGFPADDIGVSRAQTAIS